MDWRDLGHKLADFAPLLGTLVGGPAGPAVGALIASTLGTRPNPDDVAQALVTSPDAAIKLRELEVQQRVQLQQLAVTAESNRLAADTAALQAVNATMQAEAKADHWPTYSWRPFCGFVFGTMVFGVYFVLPLAHIAPPAVPPEAWLAMGAVLGVASYFRGKMQADPAIPTDNRG
jgi:hypothetical protein